MAQQADVGVASVFRNFGTKEQLVLWDEYDPLLLQALSRELGAKPPLAAMEAALVESLGSVYAMDGKHILRRANLIAQTPELQQATRAGCRRCAKALPLS